MLIREDWQRDIVAADLDAAEKRLAKLEAEPDAIPVIERFDGGGAMDRAMAVSALSNLIYGSAIPMAKDRDQKLLDSWPSQKNMAKQLLEREVAVSRKALAEYDAAR